MASLQVWVSPGCSALKGLLWSHAQSVNLPGILLGQRSSPCSEGRGSKSKFSHVFRFVDAALPTGAFPGSHEAVAAAAVLPCCVTMTQEQQLLGWPQRNSGDLSQL